MAYWNVDQRTVIAETDPRANVWTASNWIPRTCELISCRRNAMSKSDCKDLLDHAKATHGCNALNGGDKF